MNKKWNVKELKVLYELKDKMAVEKKELLWNFNKEEMNLSNKSNKEKDIEKIYSRKIQLSNFY